MQQKPAINKTWDKEWHVFYVLVAASAGLIKIINNNYGFVII